MANTHGGARPGSGRKLAGDKRDVHLGGVRLTRAKLDAYKHEAEKRGMTLTEFVESTLDAECDKKHGERC